ncbi:spore germination protein [Bacillus sp. DNRA2]|uniref:spore germination protein n=1 Tax=Bacillus sp. DNRA2 TaxID=2723053 RepID=UPI00145E1BBC|nr:spore germination protein [Bacillus sp. DNRA2]NMD70904.1 spore germination protein [Bacillus sp. DNRA2]
MTNHITSKEAHKQTIKRKSFKSLSADLQNNIDSLQGLFEACDDLNVHYIKIKSYPGCLIYFNEMVNRDAMQQIETGLTNITEAISSKDDISPYINQQFAYSYLMNVSSFESIAEHILEGNTILMVNNLETAFVFKTSEVVGRQISIPEKEQTIRGPQEGFVEDLHKNVLLIRKKLKTTALKIDQLTIGKQVKTKISVMYIKGKAKAEVVAEVHQRLAQIETDGILDSHFVESKIKDEPWSPLPTVFSTERPDRICGSLIDGKVAILVDGSPYVLTVPALFVEFLHSGEDYYDGALAATIIRWVRFLGLFVTLILPAFYIALITFHQDLLQNPFLIRIAANREALPYPALIEAIFMYLTYELLREAGLRMPKPFGGSIVTILGLVLIGQAAVHAGIVGPIMAIVVSVTALTSFILPNYAFHQIIRFSGLPLLILAGFFGFMGIIVGLMFGLTYLISIRSFGTPYFFPVSPARKENWKDVFIRAPRWAMDTRPIGYGVEPSSESHSSSIKKEGD